MVYIVMGVAGSGKTTVGEALAQRLNIPFHDGDDFHPRANVEKMSAGIPLTDDDRWPWLDALATASATWEASGGAVLACSALKQVYRDRLISKNSDTKFVYLEGSRELLLKRLQDRPHHYMKPEMLTSQLATLEPPRDALRVDISQPPEEIVNSIMNALGKKS
ncbi:MAG: gluconokinase [Candidatus Sumerlaeota bacterium]